MSRPTPDSDRENRRDVGSSWSRYERLRAVTAAALTAPAVTTELYERLCSLEQTVSDVAAVLGEAGAGDRWRRWVEALRAASVDAAGALWFERALDASWADRLRQSIAGLPGAEELQTRWRRHVRDSGRLPIFEYLDTWPIWPECLSTEPVDWCRYARRVAALVASTGSAPDAVVGLRTSGSFLGPVWAAAIQARDGSPAAYLTVRPVHASLRARIPALPAMLDDTVDLGLLRGRRVVVVDDLAGTGNTVRSTLDFLAAAGTERDGILVSLYRCSSVGSVAVKLGVSPAKVLLVHRSHQRWPQATHQAPSEAVVRSYFQQHLAQRPEPADVMDVRPLRYGYALRYAAAVTGAAPADLAPHLHGAVRHRRYLLRVRTGEGGESTLVAKPLGFGYFADEELSRLSTLPHAPRAYGIVGGYLLYFWEPGAPLPMRDRSGPGHLDPTDLDAVGAVAAFAGRRAPGGTYLPREAATLRIGAVVEELRGRGLRGLPRAGEVVAAIEERWIPVVAAPPNNGHWHYVRRPDGGLVKLHREVGNVLRRSDPAEDIAAAAVELDLTPTEVGHVADRFSEYCGDRPSAGRLAFGVMQHVGRALREFGYYRDHVASWVSRPVRDGDDGFAHREYELRDAVGLARQLLDLT
ncbi:phosphoribosyltransferase [Micromonospora sp. KC606]|uniref:phosphoribosyltransferase n=1 Tax=Micromonospora sp. KC606 TaxID=2530379 RepID=UPI0010478619|nr:phosphoribosyltransferase [Micromonospora sp. KC606]TDC85514.1 phosphoribosyltransferase [Micromonospora sp. KC606]